MSVGALSGARICSAQDLALELLDPGSQPLHRLFRHPGGDWEPTPEQYRNERVDPPAGRKGAFAVLYLANTLPCVAMECRILRVDFRDHYTWDTAVAAQYRVVRYLFSKPAIFMPIDKDNERVLGLDAPRRAFASNTPFQEAALALHERFGDVVHGLSWASKHRNQPGRIYALWHRHKPTIGLTRPADRDYPQLTDDAQWGAFLAAHPEIEAIDGSAA